MRLNKNGDDVTDCGEAWTKDDIMICGTNYPHPSITSGQHTNGPVTYWFKLVLESEWTLSKHKNLHSLRKAWIDNGIEGVV